MDILIVASTRPEIVKLSPVMRELEKRGESYYFVTTGQHYDRLLFKKFIEELNLKDPDFDIEVGSGTQAYQTSSAMIGLEKLFIQQRPDIIVVEGDTNSVLSTALAAVKLKIPVAHVEAGLRSFDMTMPEEINRIVADRCSQLLFAPTERSALNLINDGILPDKIFIVGNTVVDATLQNLEIAKEKSSLEKKFPGSYLVLTLHRAENVDVFERLEGIVKALSEIKEKIIFPVHPRTRRALEEFKLFDVLKKSNVVLIDPLGYLDFLVLMNNSKAILTDSGGIQEEAITLNIPCVTLRRNTERPETVEAGGNILAGVETASIRETVDLVLNDEETYNRMKRAGNPFGKGDAGKKIVDIIEDQGRKGLKIQESDFTEGFSERSFIAVDSNLEGKKIEELEATVLKVIEDGRERFPWSGTVLKIGQLIEVIKKRD